MKYLMFDLLTRLIVILIFFLFPIVAIAGAPWALYSSVGNWGHTPWRDWCDDWSIYSRESLTRALQELVKPIHIVRNPT